MDCIQLVFITVTKTYESDGPAYPPPVINKECPLPAPAHLPLLLADQDEFLH